MESRLSLRDGDREFPPATMSVAPATFIGKNRRKIEPKDFPSCLIAYLLVVFTQQHKILVTTLV